MGEEGLSAEVILIVMVDHGISYHLLYISYRCNCNQTSWKFNLKMQQQSSALIAQYLSKL